MKPDKILLREVIDADLPIFFEQQLDTQANWMAAFTVKEPANREAYDARWRRIRAEPTVIIRTIVYEGAVVGSVLSYEDEGKPEVSYWLGREFWGKGIATWALGEFLWTVNQKRPMVARVAKDNLVSRRVLEKCGFARDPVEWQCECVRLVKPDAVWFAGSGLCLFPVRNPAEQLKSRPTARGYL